MIEYLYHRIVGGNGSYVALALLRVALGAHLAIELLCSWPFLDYLYGPDSFVQAFALRQGWIAVDTLREHHVEIALLHLGAAMLMMGGIGGRTSIITAFASLEALHALNGFILNGGDTLTRFLLLFLSIGESHARLAFRRQPEPAPDSVGEFLSRMAAICIIIQLCTAYVVSGLSKISSAEMWQNGTAVYYVLQHERFMGTELGAALVKIPFVCAAATYGTLAFEIYFPCLLWHRRTKRVATVAGGMLHGSIAIFMMIYDFQLIFMYAYLLLWSDADFAGALSRWPRLCHLIAVKDLPAGAVDGKVCLPAIDDCSTRQSRDS